MTTIVMSPNFIALLRTKRCPSCDQFSFRAWNLENQLETYKERVKHIFPKNFYQLRETLSDKLDTFDIPYTDEQKLFRIMAIFDFQSLFVHVGESKVAEIATWIGKQIPLSISISSNLVEDLIFIYEVNLRDLVSSSNDTLENTATQSKTQVKMNFLLVESTIPVNFEQFIEILSQRPSHPLNRHRRCLSRREF